MTLLRMFHDKKLIGSNSGRRFDHIFFIKVSHVVDVEKIKKDIADQLGRSRCPYAISDSYSCWMTFGRRWT